MGAGRTVLAPPPDTVTATRPHSSQARGAVLVEGFGKDTGVTAQLLCPGHWLLNGRDFVLSK